MSKVYLLFEAFTRLVWHGCSVVSSRSHVDGMTSSTVAFIEKVWDSGILLPGGRLDVCAPHLGKTPCPSPRSEIVERSHTFMYYRLI